MDPIEVRSCVLVGVRSEPVTVKAIDGGDPRRLRIVGLPEVAERETRMRVSSALRQFDVDALGVTVHVSPEQSTASESLDLPIALAVAAVRGKGIPQEVLAFGALSLDGRILSVRGAFAHARALSGMRVLCPAGNADAVSLSGKSSWCAETLGQVFDGRPTHVAPTHHLRGVATDHEIGDVPQASLRRALEIAAAGRHSLLLIGPPGSGKVIAARRLVSILPALDGPDAAEVAEIHDVAGLRHPFSCDVQRPLRAPYHTVSEIGLVGGGGSLPRPGEVSLAHGGVLLLDEIQEFRRSVLITLAHTLREGQAACMSHGEIVRMPARPVVVVGTANPCPCGGTACGCTESQKSRWNGRLASCPIQFDMRVRIIPTQMGRGLESSNAVRARVQAAWDRSGASDRVAETIAHLDGYESPKPEHDAEARTLMEAL